MRGSQSDPTHTHAPRMHLPAHATRVLTRAERVYVRARANTTLHHAVKRALHRFGAGHLTGLQGGEAGGLYAGLGGGFYGHRWPDLGPC